MSGILRFRHYRVMLMATSTPNLVSIHIFHDDQLQQDRVYIFCSDVHVQNQRDLFTKVLDNVTKHEGVL